MSRKKLNVWDHLYTDYVTLIATSNEEFQKLASAVRHNVSFGLNISEAKTNIIILNEICPVRVDLVPKFKYLGSTINIKDTTSEEIRVKLATAKNITSGLVYIWKDDYISISFKNRFVYSLGWSEAQYGNESWTLKKEDEKRIHAFELCGVHRTLRKSWTQSNTSWI